MGDEQLKDIEIAKNFLEEENLCIVAIKAGNIIFKSNEKGIKPMYIMATEMKEDIVGASIADRVIGKGAAILCKYLGIKEVYSKLISNNAIDVLGKSGIKYTYDKICPYIKNRDRTDICPIEKLTKDVDDGDILLKRIENFMGK